MNDNERHVEIKSPTYSYSGSMTRKELSILSKNLKINADDVTIGGLVMYGWDEVDMLWAATAKHETNLMWLD